MEISKSVVLGVAITWLSSTTILTMRFPKHKLGLLRDGNGNDVGHGTKC